jgi:hypothetical protein
MPSFFDAYDYVGYIVPGAILLLCFMYMFPAIREQFGSSRFDLTEIGAFIIIAFVIGQMLHQIGHVIDIDFPRYDYSRRYHTDAVACQGQRVLSDAERLRVLDAVKAQFDREFPNFRFGTDCPIASLIKDEIGKPPKTEDEKRKQAKESASIWRDIVGRINIQIRRAKMSERLDIFNRGLGLHMALSSAFSVLVVGWVIAVAGWKPHFRRRFGVRSPLAIGTWRDFGRAVVVLAALLGALWISINRMDYFALTYARELFLTYLQAGSSPFLV